MAIRVGATSRPGVGVDLPWRVDERYAARGQFVMRRLDAGYAEDDLTQRTREEQRRISAAEKRETFELLLQR